MTILPKKKTSQGKNSSGSNDGNENVENGNVVVVGGHQHSSSSDSRDRLYPGGRASPPRWPSLQGGREDKRGPTHVSQAGGTYQEYESLDSSVGGTGGAGVSANPSVVSVQHKRRHRASPHRNVRKHRDHRSANASSNAATMANGPGIAAPPSTSASTTLASGNKSPNAGTSTAATQATDDVDGLAEDFSGYNSGDEYCQPSRVRSEEEWSERERIFEKKMRKKGLIIKKMGEDGACLFRAVADQIYGDQEMHAVIRKHCMDYMAKNADYFSQYVTEDFETYLKRKRLDHIHGNHVEMQALCEIYNRSIEVYSYSLEPINTFHSIHATDNEPIRISYHKNIHYNSIVDPYKATVGVGLGLPGFIPGLAEKNLMHDAVRQSEEFHIEQTMLEDKLKATDWEATNEAIEEQVARESYLQWLRDNERRNRKASTRSATATCSSSGIGGASPDIRSPTGSRSPRGRPTPSAGNSPARDDCAGPGSSGVLISASSPSLEANKFGQQNTSSEGSVSVTASSGTTTNNCDALHLDFRLLETATFINQLPPDVFGLTEWEDADILAQVLAASQQEYLDSLKRSVGVSGHEDFGKSVTDYVKPSTSLGAVQSTVGLDVAATVRCTDLVSGAATTSDVRAPES